MRILVTERIPAVLQGVQGGFGEFTRELTWLCPCCRTAFQHDVRLLKVGKTMVKSYADVKCPRCGEWHRMDLQFKRDPVNMMCATVSLYKQTNEKIIERGGTTRLELLLEA